MKNTVHEGLTCFNFEQEVMHSPLTISKGLLFLETNAAPDYYAKNNFPPNKNHPYDRHFYLLVKNPMHCFQDLVQRHTGRIRKEFNFKLRVFPGQMTYGNKEYQCIRVNTKDIDQLAHLVDELEKIGIKFVSDKKVSTYTSQIFYKKYIEFIQLEEGVYQDKNNPNRYFFELPKQIDYETFKKGIVKIKNNCNFHLFDAFMGYLFMGETARDFVGIYSEHCDRNRFTELLKQLEQVF